MPGAMEMRGGSRIDCGRCDGGDERRVLLVGACVFKCIQYGFCWSLGLDFPWLCREDVKSSRATPFGSYSPICYRCQGDGLPQSLV